MSDFGIFDLRKWAHVKHISEISADDQEKAFAARDKINQIFETYILLPPKKAKLQMKEAAKLIEDIEKLGFFIDIRFLIKNVGEDSVLLAEIGLYTLKTKTIH